jgi:hypothetical protein
MNERSIEVVIDAFIIIIGIAVERFITAFPLRHDPVFRLLKTAPRRRRHRRPFDHMKWPKLSKLRYWWSYFVSKSWYWICYACSLAVIVTLVLRFLLGADLHLRNAYLGKQDIHNFAWDIFALMCFGAFIVGAALAKYVRHFAWWLAGCSGVGTIWSALALRRVDPHTLDELLWWWLKINSIQLAVALGIGLLCWCLKNKESKDKESKDKESKNKESKNKESKNKESKNKKYVMGGLVFLSFVYMLIFPCDLRKILKMEPQKQGTCIQGPNNCPH